MNDITNQIQVANVNNDNNAVARRKYESVSDEKRQLIVDLMRKGMKCVEVAANLRVNPSTVSTIYGRYVRSGQSKKKPKGHAPRKLTVEHGP